MSGTAALAAARKRRANPQPNVSSYSSNTNSMSSSSNSITSIKEENENQIPKATNPAMLLMQHNMLIQRLQKDITELKSELNAEKELKPKGPEIDYKSEYLGLLEEMKEMKKVLLKVQSFSMETNLEVMKLKRITNEKEKVDLSSITITDDIETVV